VEILRDSPAKVHPQSLHTQLHVLENGVSVKSSLHTISDIDEVQLEMKDELVERLLSCMEY
jgi:hypothetical protein